MYIYNKYSNQHDVLYTTWFQPRLVVNLMPAALIMMKDDTGGNEYIKNQILTRLRWRSVLLTHVECNDMYKQHQHYCYLDPARWPDSWYTQINRLLSIQYLQCSACGRAHSIPSHSLLSSATYISCRSSQVNYPFSLIIWTVNISV
jgi:hypothetical protein